MPAWSDSVAALAMVLGANLGSALNPLIDASLLARRRFGCRSAT